jgi:hypothetical protein
MSGFYCFNQYNSGGSFDFDPITGITRNVIIEGISMEGIINRAEDLGIYFDGCDSGRDCPCCGDRWYRPWDDDMDTEPKVYGTPVADFNSLMQWMPEGAEVCVHYLDGRKEWFGAGTKPTSLFSH